MQVNLDDKITRFVVRTYAEKIVNYTTQTELDYYIHKFVHTFQVVQMAQKLVDLSVPALPARLKKTILNAAVLHDVGRCYEFKNGVLLHGVDHGQMGAQLIHHQFPDLKVEIESTRFHNKLPSDKDKTFDLPVLDYVRDSDMLGNIVYQIDQPDVFLIHLLPAYVEKGINCQIDSEIENAVRERRGYIVKNCQTGNFLTMILGQLTWFFLLKTPVAKKLVTKDRLFIRFRDMIIARVLPKMNGSEKEKKQALKKIMTIFKDDVFKYKEGE